MENSFKMGMNFTGMMFLKYGGVLKYGKYRCPKWMVYNRKSHENPNLNMDDLEVALFWDTSIGKSIGNGDFHMCSFGFKQVY
jgi:hypothetical protein